MRAGTGTLICSFKAFSKYEGLWQPRRLTLTVRAHWMCMISLHVAFSQHPWLHDTFYVARKAVLKYWSKGYQAVASNRGGKGLVKHAVEYFSTLSIRENKFKLDFPGKKPEVMGSSYMYESYCLCVCIAVCLCYIIYNLTCSFFTLPWIHCAITGLVGTLSTYWNMNPLLRQPHTLPRVLLNHFTWFWLNWSLFVKTSSVYLTCHTNRIFLCPTYLFIGCLSPYTSRGQATQTWSGGRK